MKIRIKCIGESPKVSFIKKGEWVDLYTREDCELRGPLVSKLIRVREEGKLVSHRDIIYDSKLIPLGIAMELPEEFEAIIAPRSSTFNKFGLVSANSIGIIDSSYCGDEDEWNFNAIAFRDTTIKKGTRICQFRIQPSQKASILTKLKWLFTNKIEFEFTDKLNNPNRGGFGSTGDTNIED